MFAVDGLSDDQISLLLDQLSFSHYLILRHVNRRFRNAIDRRYMMPKRIEYAACFGRTIEEKEEQEDGQPATAQSQKIVVRAARLIFANYDDIDYRRWPGVRCEIVVDSQTQSLFVVRDHSDTFTSRYPIDFNGFMATFARLSRTIKDISAIFEPNPTALEKYYGWKRPRMEEDAAFEVSGFFRSLGATTRFWMEGDTDEYFRKVISNYRGECHFLTIHSNKPPVGRCRQCQMRYGPEIPWECEECKELWSEGWGRNWQYKNFGPYERAPIEMTWDYEKYPSIHYFTSFIDLAICPSRPQQSGYLHETRIAQPKHPQIVRNPFDDARYPDIPLFLKKYERHLRTLHNGMMTFLDDTDADVELLAKWMPEELDFDELVVSELHRFRIEVYGKVFLCAIYNSQFPDRSLDPATYLLIFDK